MQLNSYSRVLVIAIAVVAIATGILTVKSMSNTIPIGYTEVKSYVHPKEGLSCAADAPACGTCDGGKVVHERCYVPIGSGNEGL